MINSAAFRGEMVAHGWNQKRLADYLGMSENTLSLKIRGLASFTLEEVEKICGAFAITEPTRKCEIFLP